ncbi:MAG: outer membrane beta-barrel protein [Nitrospirae bacterium]|nr:outer membrane beta-barrel protein [Nitrospirota bacterium]
MALWPKTSVVLTGLVMLLGLWASSPAQAAIEPGSTEVVIFGGGEHDGAQLSIFGLVLLPKPGLDESGFVVGASVTHLLSSRLGIELDYGYDPRLGETSEAAVTTATAGLMYHVNPGDKGVLYLGAGGGAAWFDAADAGVNNDTVGMGMAAIGVKVYLGTGLLLRADFRGFYVPSTFADQYLLQRTTIGLGVRF